MADVSTWSTTAASNNSASPDGWPESMLPSGVNNSARENMAQVATWRQKFGGWMMENVGLSATVGSGNLTVTLRVKDGSSAPSSTNKVGIGFRNATLTTGGFTYVEATSAINVTLPSGGTLGFANSATGYIFVYAINNAGTMELALASSSFFDEGIVHSTTGIGTGSDSANVLYSGSGRVDVAIRLIGRITIQHGAGTWSNSPTVITLWSPELRNFQSISSYVSGGQTYLHVDGANSTTFDVDANLTESTFESVGPTGSSATNVWTAMDDIPPGSKIAVIGVFMSATTDAADTSQTLEVFARQTGSAVSSDAAQRLASLVVPIDDNVGSSMELSFTTMVPLDSSRRFDFKWTALNDQTRTILLVLKGFLV